MIAALMVLASAQAYDPGSPTAAEQLVLEMINRARANPTAEGTRLGIIIAEGLSPADAALLAPKPPLTFNSILLGVARAHSLDMYTRSFFAHTNPDGDDPFERMTNAGYIWSGAGENIAAGAPDSFYPAGVLEDVLMIDAGYPGRGHRKNLLDIYASTPFREIGIGYYSNPIQNASGLEAFLTQDFGRRNAVGPFLLGVVINDANVNDFYDVGEGISGVTISHDRGASFGLTGSAGGYACLLPTTTSLVVTVTPSGGGVPWGAAIRKKRTLTGENLKVDFKTSEAVDTDGDGMPDTWETAHVLDLNDPADAPLDADADTFTNLEEYQFGSDPQNASSTPSNPVPPPPPPPPGGGSSGGGGCGALGIGVLLPVLLGAWRRRRR